MDFIIEDGKLNSLTKYMSLVIDLEEEFNCHVDLISLNAHNKDFLNKIKDDVIIFYKK